MRNITIYFCLFLMILPLYSCSSVNYKKYQDRDYFNTTPDEMEKMAKESDAELEKIRERNYRLETENQYGQAIKEGTGERLGNRYQTMIYVMIGALYLYGAWLLIAHPLHLIP